MSDIIISKELVKKQFPVNIHTKSDLVLRDLCLLKDFEEIKVGFTITPDDEKVAELFELKASPVKDRLTVLAKIQSFGIKTFALKPPDPRACINWMHQPG